MKFTHTLSILLLCAGLFSSACSEKKMPETPTPPIVGGDADAHGCRASAGYQWSTLQNNCIRSFELPLQLLNADKTSGAGVVFSTDKQKAEVFSASGTTLLVAQSATHYVGNGNAGDWTLTQTAGKWQFGKKGDKSSIYTEK